MPRTRRPYLAEVRRRLVELVRGGQLQHVRLPGYAVRERHADLRRCRGAVRASGPGCRDPVLLRLCATDKAGNVSMGAVGFAVAR